MLTFLLSYLNKVESKFLFLIVIAASWLLYSILFIIPKANRTKSRFKAAAIIGLVLTLIADIIWFFAFFDNFTYINPGFTEMVYVLALPGVMLLAMLAQSYVNANAYAHEQRKLEREAQKERKKESKKQKYQNTEELSETKSEVEENING